MRRCERESARPPARLDVRRLAPQPIGVAAQEERERGRERGGEKAGFKKKKSDGKVASVILSQDLPEDRRGQEQGWKKALKFPISSDRSRAALR